MINSNKTLLFASLICLLAVESINALNPNSNKLSGNRKPLATREDESIVEDYKRTKRQLSEPMKEFQAFINTSKGQCAKEMGFKANEMEKELLYEEQPTRKEMCMMECLLKRLEVMDADNMLSTPAIGRIADIIGDNNALVSSIAMASADNCKKFITADHPCERAFQINKCIAAEMKMRKIQLVY